MKILYIITKSNWGGAQRYVHDLALAAKRDGHAVAVAFGDHGILATKLEDAGIRTITIPEMVNDFGASGSIRALSGLYRIIRNEQPDVVHLNSSKAAVLGIIAAKAARAKRTVFTLHGWPFAATKHRVLQSLLALPIDFVIALSDVSIAVSDAVRRQTPLPIRHKMTVIHHSITCTTPTTKDRARALLTEKAPVLRGLSKDTVWIGALAELHPVKGLEYGMQAVAALQLQHRVVFVVCGEGAERARLEALIRERRLEQIVFLPGFVSDAASLLPAFDIVLQPSLSEALGYALLEAGCAGNAVVASRVGGIPELIEDGVTGLLVPPRHTTAITHALKTLIEQPALRTKLATALTQRVTDTFTPQKMYAATIATYTASHS